MIHVQCHNPRLYVPRKSCNSTSTSLLHSMDCISHHKDAPKSLNRTSSCCYCSAKPHSSAVLRISFKHSEYSLVLKVTLTSNSDLLECNGNLSSCTVNTAAAMALKALWRKNSAESVLKHPLRNTISVIPRLTNDPANEFFGLTKLFFAVFLDSANEYGFG